MIAGTLRASDGGVNDMHASANHLVAQTISFDNQFESPFIDEIALSITARRGDAGMVAIAFSAGNSADAYGVGESIEHTPPLRAGASGTNQVPTLAKGMIVRKLTPVECERLQGFPDGWTAVPYRGKTAADAPRYRALGNSMAVPVMRWIGRRIQIVDELVNTSEGVA